MAWETRNWIHRVGLAVRFNEWFVKIPLQAIAEVRKHGRTARGEGAASLPLQFLDVLGVAARYCISPADYYPAALFNVPVATRQRLISFPLYANVATRIARERDPDIVMTVLNKLTFSAAGAERGVPTVPTLLFVPRDGPVPGEIPRGDLMLKPLRGAQGENVERWRWDDDAYVGADGRRLVIEAFGPYLLQAAARDRVGVLLQPRLANHPDFLPYCGDALSTTRVSTIINESGEPEIYEMFWRISIREGAVVDNFHAGGLLFPVDLQTGALRPAIAADALSEEDRLAAAARPRPTIHPAFDTVRQTALETHRAFPKLLLAGWDVAMTDRGPRVLEGNVPPGITVSRDVVNGGMNESRLVEILGWHAERWIEKNTSPRSRWRVGADLDPSAMAGTRNVPH